MNNKKNIMKTQKKITIEEVIIKSLIIVISGIIAMYTDDKTKQWINVIAFGSGLIFTFHLRKHFFPFMAASLFFYFTASVNELFEPAYRYTSFTIMLWNTGNILLPISLFTFILQLTFTYKIVEKDDENSN